MHEIVNDYFYRLKSEISIRVTPTKKKKKIKYKKFAFKLSEKQKVIIDKFCNAKKMSPNKMIKTAIRDYISKFADSLAEEDSISENQLSLFDVDEDSEVFGLNDNIESAQTSLF